MARWQAIIKKNVAVSKKNLGGYTQDLREHCSCDQCQCQHYGQCVDSCWVWQLGTLVPLDRVYLSGELEKCSSVLNLGGGDGGYLFPCCDK